MVGWNFHHHTHHWLAGAVVEGDVASVVVVKELIEVVVVMVEVAVVVGTVVADVVEDVVVVEEGVEARM
jgi:hypothetical protein